MKKKSILISAGAALALSGAQLYLLGAKGGVGPLGFLRERKLASLPGNGEVYSFDRISPLENSPLAEKKICVLGSSVAYGAASGGWAVPEYMSHRFSCSVTKEAVSGTTLCDLRPNSYVSRMKKLDRNERYALFLCQLSTNDATWRRPLGEIGCLDCSTVTGAIEFIIRYASETWGCPVVFFTGSRYDSKAYEAMVKRLLELKELYGIGVLDLWSKDGFNAISATERKLYMADPIHPTRAGYRDWWGPEMEKQLCLLLEKRREL